MSRIWIDLANSPHVLFFAPMIRELSRAGHQVVLTARDFAQTLPLCAAHGLAYTLVGRHGGKHRLNKVLNITARAAALRRFAGGRGIDLAVSHNSYAQALAARWAGIPTATLMDYEYQPANHISFRVAHLVLVPESFDDAALRQYGAAPHRTFKYPGLKEEVYLDDFAPDPGFRRQVAQLFAARGQEFAPDRHVLVTVRPPATMAAYHRFDNPLLGRLMDRINQPHVRALVFPRTREQRQELAGLLPANAIMPEQPLDGPNLIAGSDVVVSAGGTMVREAAALGVPAYTMYWGKLGGVDRQLLRDGRMRSLLRPEDIDALRLEPKPAAAGRLRSPLRQQLIGRLLQLARTRDRP